MRSLYGVFLLGSFSVLFNINAFAAEVADDPVVVVVADQENVTMAKAAPNDKVIEDSSVKIDEPVKEQDILKNQPVVNAFVTAWLKSNEKAVKANEKAEKVSQEAERARQSAAKAQQQVIQANKKVSELEARIAKAAEENQADKGSIKDLEQQLAEDKDSIKSLQQQLADALSKAEKLASKEVKEVTLIGNETEVVDLKNATVVDTANEDVKNSTVVETSNETVSSAQVEPTQVESIQEEPTKEADNLSWYQRLYQTIFGDSTQAVATVDKPDSNSTISTNNTKSEEKVDSLEEDKLEVKAEEVTPVEVLEQAHKNQLFKDAITSVRAPLVDMYSRIDYITDNKLGNKSSGLGFFADVEFANDDTTKVMPNSFRNILAGVDLMPVDNLVMGALASVKPTRSESGQFKDSPTSFLGFINLSLKRGVQLTAYTGQVQGADKGLNASYATVGARLSYITNYNGFGIKPYISLKTITKIEEGADVVVATPGTLGVTVDYKDLALELCRIIPSAGLSVYSDLKSNSIDGIYLTGFAQVAVLFGNNLQAYVRYEGENMLEGYTNNFTLGAKLNF